MFIKNKYTKCYYNIIHRAQSRTLDSLIYVEKHHVIPRSLGGKNDNTNLIRLTGREHFICHLLLPKMTSGTDRKKMIYAIWMMCRAHRNRRSIYKVTARTYNSIKEVMRNNRTADDFTPEWKAKISVAKKGGKTWNKGRAVPEEQKARQSATRKSKNGIPGFNTRPSCRPEKAKAISDSLTGKKWIYNSNTFVDRKYLDPDKCLPYLALGWIFGFGKRPSVVKKKCTHCNKLLDPGNYQLHHGDKCKLRQLPNQSQRLTVDFHPHNSPIV